MTPSETNLSEEQQPSVGILGVTFDSGNYGVSALASGTIAAIRLALPNAAIKIIDYGEKSKTWNEYTGLENVSVRLVNLRFSKRLFLPNNIAQLILLALFIRLIPIKSWRSSLAMRHSWLRQIVTAKYNLSLNGGDSFSDIYGLSRLAYVVLPQVLILLLERPLVQMPQTYGPFTSSISRVVARYILKRSTVVYSRDHEGLTFVQELVGGKGKLARFAYDMGFALEPFPPIGQISKRIDEIKKNCVLIGFNPSGLLASGGYTKQNMFGLKNDYWSLIDAALLQVLSDEGNQILLVPHVLGDKTSGESDFTACENIMAKYAARYPGRIHFLRESLDHHETKFLIGKCDFFMGSRMHACIAALSQCVPAIGLAYSRKFVGVMELVGDGAKVIDLRTADQNLISREILQAISRISEMRNSLVQQIPELRKSVLNLCKRPEIRDIFAGIT